MSPGPTVQRDPVGELAAVVRGDGSAVLAAVRGKQRRLLCLDHGDLVFVASNVIEEQIDTQLLRLGLLTPADRARLLAEARRSGRKLGAVLAEALGARGRECEAAIAARDRELFLGTLDWSDAELELRLGRPDLSGEWTVRQPCRPLLLAHALRPTRPIEEVRLRIGPPNLRPCPAADSAARLAGLELDELAHRVVARCDGRRTISDVVSVAPPGGEERALRALYGLLLAGVLQAADEPTAGQRAGGPDAVSRDEVLARIQRGESADHYAILGLKTAAEPDEIRKAYYYLARRYHPDRFRSGELRDLLAPIERFFTRVTEAYNTLVDPARRRQYDEEQATRGAPAHKETQQDVGYLAKQNYLRGRQLAERKQFTEAVKFLTNAVQLDPTKALYPLELGRVLALNPRLRVGAEAYLRRALELDPALVDGYVALGELFEKSGREDDAQSMFREALRWDPDNLAAAERVRAPGR